MAQLLPQLHLQPHSFLRNMCLSRTCRPKNRPLRNQTTSWNPILGGPNLSGSSQSPFLNPSAELSAQTVSSRRFETKWTTPACRKILSFLGSQSSDRDVAMTTCSDTHKGRLGIPNLLDTPCYIYIIIKYTKFISIFGGGFMAFWAFRVAFANSNSAASDGHRCEQSPHLVKVWQWWIPAIAEKWWLYKRLTTKPWPNQSDLNI